MPYSKNHLPKYIRSNNGSEFTANKVRRWLGRVGVQTLFIEPGSPWENGYCESFNGKLRDELLDRELFDTLLEAKVLIERWRKNDNTIRLHSSLGDRPPAPEAFQSRLLTSATPQRATGTGLPALTFPPFLGPFEVRDFLIILPLKGARNYVTETLYPGADRVRD